jgi:Rrf2 family protein
MIFNNKIKYGIQALFYLARYEKKSIVSASTIAENLDIPKEFVAKILQSLVKGKILSSKKGNGGGFSFAVEPERLRLISVVTALGYDLNFEQCLFGVNKNCEKADCPMYSIWKEFNGGMLNIMSHYSVANFAEHAFSVSES